MAVLDISKGGITALPAGHGGEIYVHDITVDFAVDNLDTGDILRVINVPYGAVVLAARADVLEPTTAAALSTVDIGFYAAANDGDLGLSALFNELSLDLAGAAVMTPTEAAIGAVIAPAYIGIAWGATASKEIADGVLRLRVATLALT